MRKLKLMKPLQIGIVSLMVVACMKGWADEGHLSFNPTSAQQRGLT